MGLGRTVRRDSPVDVSKRSGGGAGRGGAGDGEPQEHRRSTDALTLFWNLEALYQGPQHRAYPVKCTSKPGSSSAPSACLREGLVWLRTDVSSAGEPPVSLGQRLPAS